MVDFDLAECVQAGLISQQISNSMRVNKIVVRNFVFLFIPFTLLLFDEVRKYGIFYLLLFTLFSV